jgi:hypothetical protein
VLCAFGVDVLNPAVSLRRVWVLGNRLPPWARAGGEEWSAETHMLALLADHLANLTYVTLQAAGAKGAQKPSPLPRPRSGPARAAEPPRALPHRQPGGWGSVAAELAAQPNVRVITSG